VNPRIRRQHHEQTFHDPPQCPAPCGIHPHHFLCTAGWHIFHAGRLVFGAQQAGVDLALHVDGGGGVAAWLVWQRDGWGRPLMLYYVQLLLNAAWTPIFFGAHQLAWGLAEIIIFWIAIQLTLLSFHRFNRTAAWLIAPYLAWVSFAAFLDSTLWRMNPV
jgi:hypothetical protein